MVRLVAMGSGGYRKWGPGSTSSSFSLHVERFHPQTPVMQVSPDFGNLTGQAELGIG